MDESTNNEPTIILSDAGGVTIRRAGVELFIPNTHLPKLVETITAHLLKEPSAEEPPNTPAD
jgi:hypothetical protein